MVLVSARMGRSEFFVTLLLSMFIVAPKFGGLDLSLVFLFVAVLVSFGTVGMPKLQAFSAFCTLMLLVLIGGAVAFFSALINADYFSEFTFRPVRTFLVLFGVYLLFSSFSSDKKIDVLKTPFAVLFCAATLNSVVILMQYFNHFLGVGDPLIFSNPGFDRMLDTPFRKPGMMAGYPTAGLLSLGGVLAGCFFRYEKVVRSSWVLLFLFCNFLTVFLTARTSMLVFLVFFPFLFLRLGLRSGVDGVCFGVSLFFLVGYLMALDNPFIQGTINKMFANFISYFKEGSVLDYSSRDLVYNHYELPQDLFTWLIGNSTSPGESMVNSDVFFVRTIWANGVFSLILLTLVYVYMWFVAVLGFRSWAKLYVFAIFLSIFIASFKGSFVVSRVTFDYVALFFGAGLIALSRRVRV